MSTFDLLLFLQKVLGGLNVVGIEARVQEWIETKGVEYPDLEVRAEALSLWLTETLREAETGLDPATMAETIKGIAADIVGGTAGVSRNAWKGMG